MPASKRRVVLLLWLMLALGLLLAGCVPTTPHVVKIGLVAPFEGRCREIGSDVIPAARLAVREWAAQHPTTPGSPGLAFEIVAYDDQGDPQQAVEQARKLAADPAVEIVIGHWRDDTTQAALAVYDEAGIPVVTFAYKPLDAVGTVYNLAPAQQALSEFAPGTLLNATSVQQAVDALPDAPEDAIGGPVFGLVQFAMLAGEAADGLTYVTGSALPIDNADLPAEQAEAFTAAYEEGSLGAPLGQYAVSAYQATWLAMNLIAEQYTIPISEMPVTPVEFDASGRRIDAPVYLYQWRGGQRSFVERLH